MTALLLAAALAFTREDARISYDTARVLVDECTPRDAGTVRGKIAANRLLDAASSAGADARLDRFEAETPKGMRTFHNVYAEFAVRQPSDWTVIVSHFDTKPGTKCPGANDGASTSGLLVGIANMLSRWRTPTSNVMLVWTDGEECMESYSAKDGLWGAKRAVREVQRRGYRVKAVICLDMLGDRDLQIMIPRNSSPALAKIAFFAAEQAGEKGLVKQSDELVKDDHVPFLEAGMKAIDLIDFEYGSAPGKNDYWHSPADTMDKVSERSLLKSGKVVAEMLNVLFARNDDAMR